jgi:hypothetical protein
LEQCKQLPEVPSPKNMDAWQIAKSRKEYAEAETIHWSIPLHGRKPRFEELLAAFGRSLGMGQHMIGVPLSGQLLSRNIKAIGTYTRQVPLLLEVKEESEITLLQDEISRQLAAHRKTFASGWKGELPHTSIVFNLDNLTHYFQFAGRRVKLLPEEDRLTGHDLVCNVIMEVSTLHIALKFRKDEDPSGKRQLLEKFCTILNQSYVPAAGSYS